MRLLGRRRAVLPLDRFDDAVVLEDVRGVVLRPAERLLVVGLAAFDREAVAALELRARVVALGEPLLLVPREPLLCDPLGLPPLRRDGLEVDRRLLELLDVVARVAMTLLGIFDLLGGPLAHRSTFRLRPL